MGSQNFEQMVNMYHGIYVYCGIAAIVFLVLAVALFILLKIPRIFSELTGRGAKKAIQEMVEEGTATGNLTSRKIGEDGRRHRRKAKTGSLGTARLRRRTGLTGNLADSNTYIGTTGSMAASLIADPEAAAAVTSNKLTSGAMPVRGTGTAIADEAVSGYAGMAAAAGSGYVIAETASENYGDAPTDVLGSYGDAPTDVLGNYGSAPANARGHYGGVSAAAGETMVLNGMPAADGFMVLRSIVEIHTDEVIG